MYSYIDAYLCHFHRDHKERTVFEWDKELQEDVDVITQSRISLWFFYSPHFNPSHDASDHDYSDTQADFNTVWIDPQQPPVRSSIYGNTQLDNPLARKLIYKEYLNCLNNEIDLGSPLSCQEEDQ
jgi:hypothetical protein